MKNVAMLAFGIIVLYFLWVILKNNRANIITFLYYVIVGIIVVAGVAVVHAMLT